MWMININEVRTRIKNKNKKQKQHQYLKYNNRKYFQTGKDLQINAKRPHYALCKIERYTLPFYRS